PAGPRGPEEAHRPGPARRRLLAQVVGRPRTRRRVRNRPGRGNRSRRSGKPRRGGVRKARATAWGGGCGVFPRSPDRARLGGPITPFQGSRVGGGPLLIPRAVPWAISSRPFGAVRTAPRPLKGKEPVGGSLLGKGCRTRQAGQARQGPARAVGLVRRRP